MLLRVDFKSGKPVYFQVAVAATVQGGGAYVGEHMPRFLKWEKLRRLQPHARQIAVEGISLASRRRTS